MAYVFTFAGILQRLYIPRGKNRKKNQYEICSVLSWEKVLSSTPMIMEEIRYSQRPSPKIYSDGMAGFEVGIAEGKEKALLSLIMLAHRIARTGDGKQQNHDVYRIKQSKFKPDNESGRMIWNLIYWSGIKWDDPMVNTL